MDTSDQFKRRKIDVMDKEYGNFSFDVQTSKLKSSQLKKLFRTLDEIQFPQCYSKVLIFKKRKIPFQIKMVNLALNFER